jgi:hypothetical protein
MYTTAGKSYTGALCIVREKNIAELTCMINWVQCKDSTTWVGLLGLAEGSAFVKGMFLPRLLCIFTVISEHD